MKLYLSQLFCRLFIRCHDCGKPVWILVAYVGNHKNCQPF